MQCLAFLRRIFVHQHLPVLAAYHRIVFPQFFLGFSQGLLHALLRQNLTAHLSEQIKQLDWLNRFRQKAFYAQSYRFLCIFKQSMSSENYKACINLHVSGHFNHLKAR